MSCEEEGEEGGREGGRRKWEGEGGEELGREKGEREGHGNGQGVSCAACGYMWLHVWTTDYTSTEKTHTKAYPSTNTHTPHTMIQCHLRKVGCCLNIAVVVHKLNLNTMDANL